MLDDAHHARFMEMQVARRPGRIRDVMEFRLLLEPEVAALAARRRTPEDLERLRRVLEEQDRCADADFAGLDARFHMALARCTGNEVVWETAAMLRDLVSESRAAPLITEARRAGSLHDHRLILEALEQGDPRACREAMREHLLHTGEEAGQAAARKG
ncbi:HTH-type transcriptional regulator LutR [Fundidesulfovibrio magnetotacticus]|uniref:HTH-type transcriptional regulator LutR n=1 Tax=Fundidesulfovibrio magnetotacticus TaxID=2730080 RepID=A0A6V8LLG7_9BACT|nr:FCD domain-containing protein [Fundidesulfovibrio magnetotacticus]GFK92554.1 HTH-type transcriptional regulator LutR [Fundidesulfovibrio magnetotacticus]